MSPRSVVLYDHIGREYPRLNLYLAESARLEQAIADGAGDKSRLQAELSQLKKNRGDHPYIKELQAFREAEKTFKANLGQVTVPAGAPAPLDETEKKYREELARAEERARFYKPYRDLDYEARLAYEAAELETYHWPRLIEFHSSIHEEIRTARAEGETITPSAIETGKKAAEAAREEARAVHAAALEQLKQARRQGLISKKALANGKREHKKEMKAKLNVAEFLDPKRANEEFIKAKEYELKSQTKVMKDVMNKDIADLRRKTPVETEKTSAWVSLLTLPVPGLGQLLLRQPIKAALFFIATLFIYGVALPYALGFGNYMGKGIFGLFTLAEGGTRQQRSIIFMIEGIVALILVAIAIALLIVSFQDVRRTEKGLIRGTREKNWFETVASLKSEGFPFMVSLPALLMLLFIVIVPLSTTILLSFTNQDPNHQAKFSWVGFDNYVSVISGRGNVGQAFLRILGWTLIWTAAATTSAILMGFILALLTNNPRVRGKVFFRTIYLLPWAVPAFITIMFFSLMVAPGGAITGFINTIAEFLSGTPKDIRIKDNALYTRVALIMLQTWLGSAYIFLLSTGVLQAIPEDLYEAAQIDGASSWQKVSKITVPLVLFQTAPLLVGQYTFNFNNFSVIRLFNSGGPFDPSKYGNLGGSSDLLITYIYNLVMQRNYQAMGAAITMMVSLGLMLFTFIGFRNSKAFREERL